MRIVRVTPKGRARSAERIFIGDVDIQAIVGDGASRDLRLVEVHFANGARNRLHTHTTDQILVITAGAGIVATRSERHEAGPGDVALIPAGEEHWHGAAPGHDMTHLAINGAGSRTTILD